VVKDGFFEKKEKDRQVFKNLPEIVAIIAIAAPDGISTLENRFMATDAMMQMGTQKRTIISITERIFSNLHGLPQLMQNTTGYAERSLTRSGY